MISVIIPTFNEENILLEQLGYFGQIAKQAELIFVDGRSEDNTVKIAQQFGKVIVTAKGRAGQMNEGAKLANGQILLFLHADTKVKADALLRIEQAVKTREFVGGCLSQVLDEPSLMYRWIAFTGNVRAKLLKIFYGDQGIFVRKEIFERIGGFPDVTIGEDVIFTKQLKKEGRVGILDEKICCSTRRWQSQGIVRTSLINWRITAGLIFGEKGTKLSKRYQDIR